MESKIKYSNPGQIFRKIIPKNPAKTALAKWMLVSGLLFLAVGSGIAFLFPNDPAITVACAVVASLAFGFCLMLLGPEQWRFSYLYLQHVLLHAGTASLGLGLGMYLIWGALDATWLFVPLLACIPTASGLLLNEWENHPKVCPPVIEVSPRNLAKEFAVLSDSKYYLVFTVQRGDSSVKLGYSIDPEVVQHTPLPILLSVFVYYYRDRGNPLPDFEKVMLCSSRMWPLPNNYYSATETFSEVGLKFSYRLVWVRNRPLLKRICRLDARVLA